MIDASLFIVALRAAPLKRLYQLSLAGYSAEEDSLVVLDALVAASQGVTQRDGSEVEAWVTKSKRGTSLITYWIDKRTRALAQEMIFFGPSAAHLVLTR